MPQPVIVYFGAAVCATADSLQFRATQCSCWCLRNSFSNVFITTKNKTIYTDGLGAQTPRAGPLVVVFAAAVAGAGASSVAVTGDSDGEWRRAAGGGQWWWW